jgi:hypothetical protein
MQGYCLFSIPIICLDVTLGLGSGVLNKDFVLGIKTPAGFLYASTTQSL